MRIKMFARNMANAIKPSKQNKTKCTEQLCKMMVDSQIWMGSSVARGGGRGGGAVAKSLSISVKTFFFFFFFFLETTLFWAEKTFEFRILAEKSLSISVKTFFFFLETTLVWAEKSSEFPSFPKNIASVFGQTVWNWFKDNENSGQGRLHFSHSFKIAPPFSKSWLRACGWVRSFVVVRVFGKPTRHW